MADEDEEEPAITLGEGAPVEGAPLARVAERLMWGIERSAIREREGETTIRTPDGPQSLASILDDIEHTYFGTRQEFEEAVRSVIGSGPIPTADENSGGETAEAESADDDTDATESAENGTDEAESADDDTAGAESETE